MTDRFLQNTALFTGPDDDCAQQEARAYIKEHGYTADDVKLVRRDGVIQVITKREIMWQRAKLT